MIYWRMAEQRPASEVWARGLRRAGFLYAVYLGLAISIIALTVVFRRWWPDFVPFHSGLIAEDAWLAALLVPTLLFQPGFADVLPMYFVFLAATPWVVLMTRAGRLGWCVGASAVLWVLAQFQLGDRMLTPVVEYFGSSLPFFDILGWQVVFLGGLVLGMRRAMGRDPVVPRSAALLAVSSAVVVLCLVASYGGLGAPSERGGLGWLERRSSFGPLRALNTAAVVVLVARLSDLRTPWLEQRWLALLGAHSLAVFVYSCFLGYALTPFDRASDPVRVAAVAIGLASLSIPALLQQRYRAARAAARAGRVDASLAGSSAS
jgi:hypothetical protein